MTLLANPKFFGPLLTLLFVAICLLAIFAVREERLPKSGVEAYLENCAGDKAPDSSCGSVAAIRTAFGFDLLAEIENRHDRMRETAKKIAEGQLTAAGYQDCLKAGECAAVPMLDKDIDPESAEARKPENVRISKMFWDLAEKDRLTDDVCGLIPLCAMALDKKIIVLENGKVTGAKP